MAMMMTVSRVLGSKGRLAGLPSLHFQSSLVCFIYKVQGFLLYLAEGIGNKSTFSKVEVPRLLSFTWLLICIFVSHLAPVTT